MGYSAFFYGSEKIYSAALLIGLGITLLSLIPVRPALAIQDTFPEIFYQLAPSLIIFFLLFSQKTTKLPALGMMKKISHYSYTLYVCHFPLLLLGFSLTHGWAGKNLFVYYSLALLFFSRSYFLASFFLYS